VSNTDFTVVRMKVSELEVDPRIQREQMKMAKVNKIVKEYNPDAVGLITVSLRKDRGHYIIDGWHRVEAVRRVTDNMGEVTCRVFTGLSLPEEAQMFLDLNYANQPSLLDKFRVSLAAENPRSKYLEEITRAHGWKITVVPSNANINAVGRLENLYEYSQRIEAEPNLVELALKVITHAWGHDRHGAQAVILEGLGRLLGEHRGLINLDRLVGQLKQFKGGPEALHRKAREYASLRGLRVAMAVADIITEEYNKGLKKGGKNNLPTWRIR
jgi:hypothetical protein